MSQTFREDGKNIPVTLIEVGPCFVTQIKKNEKDGYEAVQIGFKKIEKEKKLKKTLKSKPYSHLREIRIKNESLGEIKEGDQLDISLFNEGDLVTVSGVSKGKGFSGAVKRWSFVDKAKAHGAKDMRQLRSTGSRYPQRVIKGRHMAGHMGHERTTVKHLRVIKVDKENNVLAVRGAVPGARGTLLEIKGKNK